MLGTDRATYGYERKVLVSGALAFWVSANRGAASLYVWKCRCNCANTGRHRQRSWADGVVMPLLSNVAAVSRREPFRAKDACVLAIAAKDMPQLQKALGTHRAKPKGSE